MKHRNVRSGSLPTITRPPPRVAKIASEAALAEVEEEDEEMYPGEKKRREQDRLFY